MEQVTREVVLKKKPSAEAALKSLLEAHSGEIERHLASSKIAPTARDRGILVHDYPMLPVRRRFWERVLRAVDKAGTGAQLRTQLWIVYDAVEKTADLPLGNVVDAAFIYDHIKSRVLQSGVLLQEISETIAKQVHEEDGELRFRLCALVFLIGQLPHDGPERRGHPGHAETLADLLVTDLNQSSAELRKKVAVLLEKLVADGAVMQVENEYRMQTREGSEWNQAFQAAMYEAAERRRQARQRAVATAQDRLQRDLREAEAGPRAEQGAPQVRPPLRVGAARAGRRERAGLGPRRLGGRGEDRPGRRPRGGRLRRRRLRLHPPQERRGTEAGHRQLLRRPTTLHAKGHPGTPEGMEASRAMETRLEQARRTRDNLIEDCSTTRQVYLAGGDEPSAGMLLETKVQDAAKPAWTGSTPGSTRPTTPTGTRSSTGQEGRRRRPGGRRAQGRPRQAPRLHGDPGFVGSGKKGTKVRKQFAGPHTAGPRTPSTPP